MTAAFTYNPPTPQRASTTHALTLRLERHPTNLEAAAIMGLTGYRSIERDRTGRAVVRFERFGREPIELRLRLANEVRRVCAARILDR